jgi:hypothetical protein
MVFSRGNRGSLPRVEPPKDQVNVFRGLLAVRRSFTHLETCLTFSYCPQPRQRLSPHSLRVLTW